MVSVDPPVTRRELVLSLSLANLVYMSNWTDFQSLAFFAGGIVGPAIYVAAVINVLALAVVFAALAGFVRRSGSPRVHAIAGFGLLLLLFIPLDWLRRQSGVAAAAFFATYTSAILSTLTLAVAAVLGWRYFQLSVRIASQVVMVLAPFVLFTFGGAWYEPRAQGLSMSFGEPARADSGAALQTHRVVWLVFDELDQRAVFDAPPADLRLPAFDRLRRESVVFMQAVAAGGMTSTAIPSLLTGDAVREVNPEGTIDLSLRVEGAKEWESLKERSIFAALGVRGIPSRIVGWYLPYCHIFLSVVEGCEAEPLRLEVKERIGVLRSMRGQVQRLLLALPLVRRLGGTDVLRTNAQLDHDREAHLRRFNSLSRRALAEAASPRGGLLYLHMPAPHLPAIYDRQRLQFRTDAGGDYFDNVAMADRFLGELRAAMEAAGTWDTSTLIVSSDHWWRVAPQVDQRVPFLVRAPELPAAAVGTRVHAVQTRRLIESAIERSGLTAAAVSEWANGDITNLSD